MKSYTIIELNKKLINHEISLNDVLNDSINKMEKYKYLNAIITNASDSAQKKINYIV